MDDGVCMCMYICCAYVYSSTGDRSPSNRVIKLSNFTTFFLHTAVLENTLPTNENRTVDQSKSERNSTREKNAAVVENFLLLHF